jgi:hypothetical protein
VEYRDCSQLQHWHSSRHAAEPLRFYDSARDRPSYFRCEFADCSHDLYARNGSRTKVKLKALTECFVALRVSPALGGDKGCRPFPHAPFSACGALPPLRSGHVSLDEAEHFLHNRSASVATLRWCSGSSRNAVRNHPGFTVRFRWNPH